MTATVAIVRTLPMRVWLVALAVASFVSGMEWVLGAVDSWATSAVAGLRNLLVTTLVIVIAEIVRARGEGRPTASEVAPSSDWLDSVRRGVAELQGLADHLGVMVELGRRDSELAEEAFVRLDDLRWLLADYVLKGARVRHLVELPRLLQSMDDHVRPGPEAMLRAIRTVRWGASDVLQRIYDTNTVTADWLLAHRVALPDPDYFDCNVLLGRYERLQITPDSVAGDPLYLLICHVHDILETVECLSDVEHPVLDVLEAQLGLVLSCVRAEITAVQAFNAAQLSLARQLRSADAP